MDATCASPFETRPIIAQESAAIRTRRFVGSQVGEGLSGISVRWQMWGQKEKRNQRSGRVSTSPESCRLIAAQLTLTVS